MNEIRDLLIGIDIGKEYTQICYYDRKAEEARSLSMKVGTSQYEAPGCICYRTEQNDYCVGLEAQYFSREKGGIMLGNIYDICQKEESIQVAGEDKEPAELLAHFLKGMLKFLGIQDIVKTQSACVSLLLSLMPYRCVIIRGLWNCRFSGREIHAYGLRGKFLLLCIGPEKRNLEPKCGLVCV